MIDKFLVTGGTGFIGSNLVRALVKKGKNVSVIVRNRKLNWRLKDISDKLKIYESDILNPSLPKIIREINPTYIFHLAAYGVLPLERDIKEMSDVNIKGTKNLIDACSDIPFKLMVNTGTFFEYGGALNKINEESLLNPVNDYAKSKVSSTLYVQQETKRNNLPIMTLRIFSPFGYYEDKNRLIPSVILSLLRNETINVSVPTTVRDFIFIEDVVEAYLRATQAKFSSGDIINIGSGAQHSIKEVINIILKITKSRSRVEWGLKQDRFTEPKNWEANVSKAKEILKWEPKHTLEQGLLKTIKWFKKNFSLYV